MLYIYKYIPKRLKCVTTQRYKETHCTTIIHKQKTQEMITTIIICMHNAQILITTTTMHTQHTNIYYNLSQMVKKISFQSTFESGE